jgi:hypothetical protein
VQTNRPDWDCMGRLVREARKQERAAHLRALAVDRWTRAWCEQDRGRGPQDEEPDAAADPVDAALTVLESDLSYLEDLPAARVATGGGALDELDDRMKRLIASLTSPS